MGIYRYRLRHQLAGRVETLKKCVEPAEFASYAQLKGERLYLLPESNIGSVHLVCAFEKIDQAVIRIILTTRRVEIVIPLPVVGDADLAAITCLQMAGFADRRGIIQLNIVVPAACQFAVLQDCGGIRGIPIDVVDVSVVELQTIGEAMRIVKIEGQLTLRLTEFMRVTDRQLVAVAITCSAIMPGTEPSRQMGGCQVIDRQPLVAYSGRGIVGA